MLKMRHLPWALMLALGWLTSPAGAQTQGATQPTADGYALYDKLAATVIGRSGLEAPEAATSGQLGCQRYSQAAEVVIRFAITSSLEPGLSLDSPQDQERTEARRETANLVINDAQSALGQMATSGATTAQCGAIARAFGAQAFSLALSINRANVRRRTEAFIAGIPAPPSTENEKTADEIAAEEAAQAAADKLAAEKAEAERIAADKRDHAFANLAAAPPPAPPKGQAQPISFNVYLLDNPAAREAKDFRVCFEPALYQRAAKPIVDLAAAALELPAAEPVADDAATAFFDQLRQVLAARFAFPADRLSIELGEDGAVKGPSARPEKAVAAGCHVYLATRTPTLAYDDSATKVGLLAQNLIEDVVLRPALDARLAALPKLEPLIALEIAPPTTGDANAPPVAGAAPGIIACLQDARCKAGVQIAVNACLQTADRRLGQAAIQRELAARGQATAQTRALPDDRQAAKDLDLVIDTLELLNGQLQASLDGLLTDGKRLRTAARDQLLSQELDAAFSVGRDQGEQSTGVPRLQCYARLADGRAVGLAAAN